MTTASPSDARLTVERRDDVLLLTLSNPTMRNALHPDIYATGTEVIAHAAGDPTLGAVVLTGAGEHFCAGGNLNRLAANRSHPPALQRDSIERFHRWVLALRRCPLPVIAAVEGNAAGAGFSLALACDLIVAAESAKFTMAYVKSASARTAADRRSPGACCRVSSPPNCCSPARPSTAGACTRSASLTTSPRTAPRSTKPSPSRIRSRADRGPHTVASRACSTRPGITRSSASSTSKPTTSSTASSARKRPKA